MSNSNAEALHRLGHLWAKVAEEHNLEKFETLLCDDFVMWYNFAPTDRTRQEFLDTLKNAYALFPNQVNEDPKVTVTTEGFVLQATMKGTLAGKKIVAPYCLVAKVRDGKVYRAEEYFDTLQLGVHAAADSSEMVQASAD